MKRTNVLLDEELIDAGKKATGFKTSKAVIDFALREMMRHHNQKRILEFKGKIKWQGNLEKMRTSRGIA